MPDPLRADAVSLHLPGAADTINHWVREKTRDKISSIVSPRDLNGLACVLANALYFRGLWAKQAVKELTQPGPFYLAHGACKHVPFMYRGGDYGRLNGLEFARLAYDRSDAAFFAILPRRGVSPERALSSLSIPQLLAAREDVDLRLHLPRFRFEAKTELSDSLSRLGMNSAFTPSADFTAMSSAGFFLNQVRHAAAIEVDEFGTTAAAVTIDVMEMCALNQRHRRTITLVFDRPFAVLICDSASGAILFSGVIYEP